ncbi:MAG: GNAT family N-acetyltransferase [Bacteriovorax sp.]
MKLTFDRAHSSDAKIIEKLYKQLVNDPNINVTQEQIELLTNDKFNYLFVGRIDELIVATAFLTICRDVMYGNQPFAVLENVVVDSSYQNSGIGKNMMSFIKSHCKSLECTKIMLLSSSKRVEAHAFFEKCGYQGNLKRGFVNYINRL